MFVSDFFVYRFLSFFFLAVCANGPCKCRVMNMKEKNAKETKHKKSHK